MNGKVLDPVLLVTEAFIWSCHCMSVSSGEGEIICCVFFSFDGCVEEQ